MTAVWAIDPHDPDPAIIARAADLIRAGKLVAMPTETVYGLAAGLWTSDVNRALRGARRLRAGLVWVNGWDACDITMPFGGFKQSGFGRDRSLHALHKYADLKSVSVTLR